MCRHRVHVSLVALLGGPDRGVVAEESDPPMAVPDQVGDPACGAAPVVRHDGVDSAVSRRPVEEHQCGALALLHQQRRQVSWRRERRSSRRPADSRTRRAGCSRVSHPPRSFQPVRSHRGRVRRPRPPGTSLRRRGCRHLPGSARGSRSVDPRGASCSQCGSGGSPAGARPAHLVASAGDTPGSLMTTRETVL